MKIYFELLKNILVGACSVTSIFLSLMELMTVSHFLPQIFMFCTYIYIGVLGIVVCIYNIFKDI